MTQISVKNQDPVLFRNIFTINKVFEVGQFELDTTHVLKIEPHFARFY